MSNERQLSHAAEGLVDAVLKVCSAKPGPDMEAEQRAALEAALPALMHACGKFNVDWNKVRMATHDIARVEGLVELARKAKELPLVPQR